MVALRARWILALELLVLGAPACGQPDPVPAAQRARTSVLLVTFDTTRADALGCYGNPEASTPNLDRLASEGVRFARAYAPAPLTLPSHATLLTGALPPEHGVRENGRAALGGELATTAELFRARGWRTAAFVSAVVLDRRFGLDRGFERYDDELGPSEVPGVAALHRDATAVTDAALGWLGGLGPDERFFAWVHYFDPHAPYRAPRELRRRVGDAYLAEVAHADAELGRLLDALDRRRTLVVFAADHGEARGEHGEQTHGALLYEATQHVPLLVRLPGGRGAGHVVQGPVQLADVLPTLAELFGWPAPATASGTSFATALAGHPLPERSVYCESEYTRLAFGWSSLRALIGPRWKLIDAPEPELYDLAADPREREDLAARRPEVVTAMAAELRGLLAGLVRRSAGTAQLDADALAALGYAQGSAANASDDLERVGGTNPMDHVATLEDYNAAVALGEQGRFEEMVPRLRAAATACPDAAAVHDLLGVALTQLGRVDEARAALDRARELDPADARIHHHLGNLQLRAQELEPAEASFRAALALDPALSEARANLAFVLHERGAVDEALAELRELVRRRPTSASTHLRLATGLEAAGRPAEMLAALRAGLEQAAETRALHTALAWELATRPEEALRDPERAAAMAREALAQEGEGAEALDTLAAALAALGRPAEAVAAAERALALAPPGSELAAQIAERLEAYRRGDAWTQ